MWQQQRHKPRPRAKIEAELADATVRRDHAAAFLDFDAYTHLAEQIDDLLEELATQLPAQRDGGSS